MLVVMRILLVEDDAAIASALMEGLERQGLADVEHVATGGQALAAPSADLVLLDLGLPDMDGLEVCRRLRDRGDVPIIVLTARGDEIDRVMGLELGADDYLVKPFGLRELVARIRAVTRRTSPSSSDALSTQTIGQLTIDRRAHRVRLGEREIAFSPKEFALLALLAEDPGAVVTRSDILADVWDPHWYGPTRTLDVHVASIRKKLGDVTWIETVRGVGFRLSSLT